MGVFAAESEYVRIALDCPQFFVENRNLHILKEAEQRVIPKTAVFSTASHLSVSESSISRPFVLRTTLSASVRRIKRPGILQRFESSGDVTSRPNAVTKSLVISFSCLFVSKLRDDILLEIRPILPIDITQEHLGRIGKKFLFHP